MQHLSPEKTWDAGFDTRGWVQRRGQRSRLMRRRKPEAPCECRGRTSWSRSKHDYYNKHGCYDRTECKKQMLGYQVRTGGWGAIEDDCLKIAKGWPTERAQTVDIFAR